MWKPEGLTREDIESFSLYVAERNRIYAENGHDREKAVSFVVDKMEKREGRVLDIGTGQGFAAVELARRGMPVTTVDISEDNLKKAYSRAMAESVVDLVDFHLADARRLPFEDGSFDTVVMINALHHLDDFEAVAEEISRVLAPGGDLIISDFTEEGFDIMDRVLESEGRFHPRESRLTINEAASLLGRFGMRCKCQDERFQEHVMIAEKA